jgi:hypothetical protein
MSVSVIEDYQASATARRVVDMNNAAVRIAEAVLAKEDVPVQALARFAAAREALTPSSTELLS